MHEQNKGGKGHEDTDAIIQVFFFFYSTFILGSTYEYFGLLMDVRRVYE